jgi:hypothetical protein
MLLASLLYLLQPAYAETKYILDIHYQNNPDMQAKFEGYSENTVDKLAVSESKEEADLKFKEYRIRNMITSIEYYEEKVIVTISNNGKNTEIYKVYNIHSWVIQPTQAEIEAKRLSKIESERLTKTRSDIEDANARLSQLNSNIAEATIRLSNLNSDAEYHHPLDDKSMNDNDLFDMNDKKELRNFNKKHKKYNASVLAFGMPMMTAGVICAGIVANEDIKASKLTGQSIKSLYDGNDGYPNWEWSDEAKVEHKKLGIAGALLGGTGLIITTLGFAW